jgi:multicomponent Na+:H+ antiporter subunit D
MQLDPNWLIAPIAIPSLAAALGLLVSYWGRQNVARWQWFITLVGTLANLATSVILLRATLGGQRLVLQVGGWAAPFGITIYADSLSAMMLSITALLALATTLYAGGTLDDRKRLNFYPLTMFLIMGVNGAFVAGDIFNLYVFFEVLLMASFALLTLGGQLKQINAGIRYVFLNLLVSTLFLVSVGIVYSSLGTLNLAHLAIRMPDVPRSTQLVIAGMLFVAYSSKAGLFPLFSWLPDSYHTPHPAVTAFFGGLLTKVGVYTLYRIFPLLFPAILQEWQALIFVMAGLTMLTGIFGAMAVNTVRRVLSFQIISHVGFIIMGLGLAASSDPALAHFGLTAGILYMIHHMIVKTALLMAGGAAELLAGSGSLLRSRLAGLRQVQPTLALLFFLAVISIAGMPPFSGFIGKLALLQGALAAGHWQIATTSLLVSFLALLTALRLWQKSFWGTPIISTHIMNNFGPPPVSTHSSRTAMRKWLTLTPIALLVAHSLAIGLFSERVFAWSAFAAAQTLDRTSYVNAVAPTDQIEYEGASHD